jgi:RND family efflux transporter MFP subunit
VGRVTLRLDSQEFSLDAPSRAGIFLIEGTPSSAGTLAARVSISAGDLAEELALGDLIVHADEAAARATVSDEEDEDGAVAFLLEQQWKLALTLARVERRDLARNLVVPASVRLPESASAALHAPLAGTLYPAEGRALPRVGKLVRAGDVLGEIEPPIDSATIAQLHALRLELDMQLVEAVHEVEHSNLRRTFAQRELDRLRALRPDGLSTLPELDAAEREVEFTIHEEDLALGRKATVERMLTERARFDTRTGSPVIRVPFRATIDGTITRAPHASGASVDAQTELVRVVDTSRVWIEGRVSEFDLHKLSGELGASATFLGLPGERLELEGAPWIAPRVAEESRSVQVRFVAQNAKGLLLDGMLAELSLRTSRAVGVLAIPAESIVMDQGLPTAYVMKSGERFERRVLRTGLRDGDFVEVLDGLAENERVAVRGAYIVRLASMSPATMEHHHH